MKSNFKRISAIVAIAILVLMYVLLLVFAVIDVPNWQRFFFACMGATIIIPVLLWLNIFLYSRMMDKREKGEGEEELSHGKKLD